MTVFYLRNIKFSITNSNGKKIICNQLYSRESSPKLDELDSIVSDKITSALKNKYKPVSIFPSIKPIRILNELDFEGYINRLILEDKDAIEYVSRFDLTSEDGRVNRHRITLLFTSDYLNDSEKYFLTKPKQINIPDSLIGEVTFIDLPTENIEKNRF